MLQMMEDHFPECLEKCYSINAPGFFPILWKLIRPFLTERTVDKIKIFGKDGWREKLLDLMDPALLPAHYGGDMMGPDNDARCRHKINYGGQFEEGAEKPASVFSDDEAQQRNIGAVR
ncbi:SEC14-like protein 2 [Haemaphysalis longicornis]